MRTIRILGVAGWLMCSMIAYAADAPTTAPAELAATPPPEAPLPPGMTRIFDGKTTEGWKQFPLDSWVAKNGVLASRGVGRGVIYTAKSFGRYRIVFDMRHVYGGVGKNDHRACVLVFCTAPQTEDEKPLDALAGIQFQPPNGGSWDYRKGHNNGGKGLFTRLEHPKFEEAGWSRIEILVDPATGTARMAVAQPPGTKAVEVLDFKDPTAGRAGPFALQMHNKGLYDEYANIAVEEDPKGDELITTKLPE
jgi:3-keto-disaccharide hydrolase